MKKLLRPKDVLLLGLSECLDIFEELADPLGMMANGCKIIYGWVPPRYRRRNYANLLWRRLKTGEIERIIKNDQPYLRLTSVGKEKIKRDFPLLVIKQKRWDKKWRLVLYDIAEISRYKRDILRMKLRELKFGMFQRSVWMTPFDFARDFKEFIEAKKLEDYVYILEAPALLVGNPQRLAIKVWALDSFNRLYEKLDEKAKDLYQALESYYDRSKKVKSGREKERLVEEKGRLGEKARRLKSRYLSLFVSDPHLPKELLPDNWFQDKVRERIREIDRLLKKL